MGIMSFFFYTNLAEEANQKVELENGIKRAIFDLISVVRCEFFT